jgi:hypothetical protein
MRNRNGYGPAGPASSPRSGQRAASGLRRPVTARGRAILEQSRRRMLGSR